MVSNEGTVKKDDWNIVIHFTNCPFRMFVPHCDRNVDRYLHKYNDDGYTCARYERDKKPCLIENCSKKEVSDLILMNYVDVG